MKRRGYTFTAKKKGHYIKECRYKNVIIKMVSKMRRGMIAKLHTIAL